MNTKSNILNRIERERLILLYYSAFEHGNLELMNIVLENAAKDDELAQMIFQISLELIDNDAQEATDKILLDLEASHLKQIIHREPISKDFENDEEIQLPPVTVRNVLTNLQEDSSINANIRNEAANAQRELKIGDRSLPDDLSIRGVDSFLRSLGLRFSESAKSLFRKVAIIKSIGFENQEMRLEATRKQNKSKIKQEKNDETGSKQ